MADRVTSPEVTQLAQEIRNDYARSTEDARQVGRRLDAFAQEQARTEVAERDRKTQR